jgi:hypothetical protein
MSWTSIKIDPADRVFSRYIRLKTKKCMNCGKRGLGNEGIVGLQASHYHSRRKESVRFDEENVDIFCIGCHKRLGTEYRNEYDKFKIRQLGQKRFDLLTLRANIPVKKDRKLVYMVYSKLLKEL